MALIDHFSQIVPWIDEARKNGGRVLVHCEAGMSRSATVVIGYLLGTSDGAIKVMITSHSLSYFQNYYPLTHTNTISGVSWRNILFVMRMIQLVPVEKSFAQTMVRVPVWWVVSSNFTWKLGFVQQLLRFSEQLGNEGEPLFYAEYIIDVMRLSAEVSLPFRSSLVLIHSRMKRG